MLCALICAVYFKVHYWHDNLLLFLMPKVFELALYNNKEWENNACKRAPEKKSQEKTLLRMLARII